MFRSVSPALPTHDLLSTKAFYLERLKFSAEFINNQLVLTRDAVVIIFFELNRSTPLRQEFCYIFAQNLEDLYAKFSSENLIKPAGKLLEKNGRLKQFVITDPNGHELRFVER